MACSDRAGDRPAHRTMMVSMEEEDGAVAPAGVPTADAAASNGSNSSSSSTSSGAGAVDRRRRRRPWYLLGAAVVGTVVLVAVGAAGGFKARRIGGNISQGGAAVPLAGLDGPPQVPYPGGVGGELRPPASSVLPSKQTTQQQQQQPAAGTRPPSIVPATTNSNSTAGGKAAPESLLELLQALQQEALGGDKVCIFDLVAM